MRVELKRERHVCVGVASPQLRYYTDRAAERARLCSAAGFLMDFGPLHRVFTTSYSDGDPKISYYDSNDFHKRRCYHSFSMYGKLFNKK